MGNFARTAKLANEGDGGGADRKSATEPENPVCPIGTLLRRNVDAETTKKMVGHSSVEMTEYYTSAAIPKMVSSIQNVLPAVNELFN